MKQVTLLTALMLFVATSLYAQQAKDLIGKWHIVKMVTDTVEMKIENRSKLLEEFMKADKRYSLTYDSVYSAEDSLENLKMNTNLLRGIFETKHTYSKGGVYILDTWNERKDWEPVTSKGSYKFDPATKRLTVTANGKTQSYTIKTDKEGLKFVMDKKSYFILAKVKE